MATTVRPGVRVLVPLGTRRAVGIVTALADASSHLRLKSILAALDSQPLLDASLMQLCRWLADYYLCSFGEAVSTALPGSVRISIQRIVKAIPPSAGESGMARALPGAAAQLFEWLTAVGPQSIRAIEAKLGAQARPALAALRRRGCVSIEEEVRGGDGPTKQQRFFRIVRWTATRRAARDRSARSLRRGSAASPTCSSARR
jgi:primosomal protein N' (replication factor Y)